MKGSKSDDRGVPLSKALLIYGDSGNVAEYQELRAAGFDDMPWGGANDPEKGPKRVRCRHLREGLRNSLLLRVKNGGLVMTGYDLRGEFDAHAVRIGAHRLGRLEFIWGASEAREGGVAVISDIRVSLPSEIKPGAAAANSGGSAPGESAVEAETKLGRREQKKRVTAEKYERWAREAERIKSEPNFPHPLKSIEIARIIASREEGATASNIKRRLNTYHPGWAHYLQSGRKKNE